MADETDEDFESKKRTEKRNTDRKGNKGQGDRGNDGGNKGVLDIISVPHLAKGFATSIISLKIADAASRGFDPLKLMSLAKLVEGHFGEKIVTNGFFPVMESLIGDNSPLKGMMAAVGLPPILNDIFTESLGDYVEQLRRDYLAKGKLTASESEQEKIKFTNRLRSRREDSTYGEALFLLAPEMREKVDAVVKAVEDGLNAGDKAKFRAYRDKLRGTDALRTLVEVYTKRNQDPKEVLGFFERTFAVAPAPTAVPVMGQAQSIAKKIKEALFGKPPAAPAAGLPTGAPALPPGPPVVTHAVKEKITKLDRSIQNWRYRR